MRGSNPLRGALVAGLAITSVLALLPQEVAAATNPARPYGAGQWEQVVWRDYCDIRNRPPSAKELASAVSSITRGNPSTAVLEARRAALAQQSVDGASAAFLGGVVRLYVAYFKHAPDTSIAYWLRRRAQGAISLKYVSSFVVHSSEFINTYGMLDNSDFVRLVYQNVELREPDAAGFTYWTRKLDRGLPQGDMMLQFSESAAFKQKARFASGIHAAYAQMIGRPATAAEYARVLAELNLQTDVSISASKWSQGFRIIYFRLVESAEYRHLTPSRPKGYCIRR